MAYTDDLVTARDNYAAILAAISADPKPTYTVNGQSFSWTQYQEFLSKQLERLNQLIAAGEPDGTPVEIISQGYT